MQSNIDLISLDRLALLHPKLATEALNLYQQAAHALTGRATVRVVQGLRTMAEQAALYAKGRTAPGPKVTNAAPGKSLHNYGLAFDFALLVDGTTISWDTGKDYDGDRIADWMEVVRIFKASGWTWGGEFKTIVDRPHLEKAFGHTWQQLRVLHSAGHVDSEGYVLI